MRIVPLVLVAGLLVAGCGSSSKSSDNGSDAAAVKQTVVDYAKALESSDTAKACSLISAAQKKKIEAAGKCEDVVAQGIKATGTDPYKNAQVGNATVSGSSADVSWTVSVKGRSLTVKQHMVKEGGQWKLDTSTKG
jgi:hypothetical protein